MEVEEEQAKRPIDYWVCEWHFERTTGDFSFKVEQRIGSSMTPKG